VANDRRWRGDGRRRLALGVIVVAVALAGAACLPPAPSPSPPPLNLGFTGPTKLIDGLGPGGDVAGYAIINNGSSSVGPLSVELVGGSGVGTWQATGGSCPGSTLAPGASCTVSTLWSAIALGNAGLTLRISAPGTTVATLEVTGSGIGPAFEFSGPTSVTDDSANGDSSAFGLVIQNSGATTAGIITVDVTVLDPSIGAVAITSDPCSGNELADTLSCAVGFSWTATQVGSTTVRITVTPEFGSPATRDLTATGT